MIYLMIKNVPIYVGAMEEHQGQDDGNEAGTSNARR